MTHRFLLAGPRGSALWASTTLLALMGLVACGGGGVDVGGTGATVQAYAEGAITGYGSIIVNGQHYDESLATVQDEAGTALSTSQLLLGAVVRIDVGPVSSSSQQPTAQKVVLMSDLIGPAAHINLSAGTLTVLGQTVNTSASTVYDNSLSGGLASVSDGQVLQVYSIYNPVTQVYVARRIEASSASSYKLRGVVSHFNAEALTCQVGGQTLVYTAANLPSDLSNGSTIVATLATRTNSAGQWVVQSAANGRSQPVDGRGVELEGVVASVLGSRLVVNGLTVEISNATLSPSGSSVAAGMRVEAKGSMSSGVLVASRLTIKDVDDDEDDDEVQRFEFEGSLSSVNTPTQTFVLRGTTIHYGQASFSSGTAANLRVGAKVEVKGTRASDGITFDAEQVKFKN